MDVLRTAYLPENLHYGMYKDGRLTEEPKSQDEEELGQGHSKEIDRKEMSAFQKMGAAVLSFFWTVYAYLFHGRSLSEARPDWSNGVVAEKHATSKAHIQSDEKSRLSALGSADMLHTSHIGMPPRFSIVDGAGLDHSQGKWRDKSIDRCAKSIPLPPSLSVMYLRDCFSYISLTSTPCCMLLCR